MSTSNTFPNVAVTSEMPMSVAGAYTDNTSPAWYGNNTTAYTPYMTPMSSTSAQIPNTTADSPPWPYNQSRFQPDFTSVYGRQPSRVPPEQHITPSFHFQPVTTPQTTFGQFNLMGDFLSPGNALGIHGSAFEQTSTPTPACTDAFQLQLRRQQHAANPAIVTPSPPNRIHPTLAPRIGGMAEKRSREGASAAVEQEMEEIEAERGVTVATRKRRRTAPADTRREHTKEQDVLLMTLKDPENDQGLSWKHITARLCEIGPEVSEQAAQMRWRRIRDRNAIWEGDDESALAMAHKWYEKNKWDLISQKMQEFGALSPWTARDCKKKWNEMTPQEQPAMTSVPSAQASYQSTLTPHSSPADSLHYAYTPMP